MDNISQFQLSSGKVLGLLFLTTMIYGIAEFVYLKFVKKVARAKEYSTTFIGVLVLILVAVVVAQTYGRINTAIIGIWASKFAIFQTDLSWYWWVYGLIIYEFFYWIQHWLAHKIRLLWCLHSPHHAPESMNMFVGFNHSFLESIFYMPFFLGFFPAIFGVRPEIIIVTNILDSIYGSFIHVSDHVIKGQLGFLEKFMQTPNHHRVHHAQNVIYMDTNYTSITLFWDYIFKTRQPIKEEIPIIYGITREVNTENFIDTHFGEFKLLWKDIKNAPSFKESLLYIFMPPGWTHSGELQTAKYLKSKMVA
jgi:sterol desaturase/sphingolipid hydroxylase (fatty acid hydroxylase superfamily)